MTREDIIRMAREAGFFIYDDDGSFVSQVYLKCEKFAALVAAAEREECAKVCEAGIHNAEDWDSSYWDQCCDSRAAAIRARGQA